MSIDSGWVAALATLVSALIIMLTAVIAVRQLRHNRNANDIVVYLRIIDTFDSPEMEAGRASIATIGRLIAEDPDYLEQLADPAFSPPEFQALGRLLRFLEHISVLITKGGVAEGLVLAEYADNFAAMWETLRPAILRRRLAFGPHTGRAFEHLALRAKRYIDSGEMDREYDALERDARDKTATQVPNAQGKRAAVRDSSAYDRSRAGPHSTDA